MRKSTSSLFPSMASVNPETARLQSVFPALLVGAEWVCLTREKSDRDSAAEN